MANNNRLREVKVETVRTRMTVESLRCDLTQEEQRVKGLDLAQQEKHVYDLNHAKKLAAEEFKEKIELATRRMTGCAQVLRDGYEYRPIECEEIYDFKSGLVRLMRKDTKSQVWERLMKDHERQMSFVADPIEPTPTTVPQANGVEGQA